MKNCYDQGCNGIGVVIATKWCYYLFYLRYWELFFQNRSRERFPPIAALMFVKFKRKSIRALSRYIGRTYLWLETVKNGQYCCLAVICRKWSAFDIQFHLIVVSIFLKTCVKDHGDSFSRLLERWIWLLCIEARFLTVLQTFWSSLTN